MIENNKVDELSDKIDTSSNLTEDEEYRWHVVYVLMNREASVYRYFLETSKLPEQSIKDIYFPKETIKKWKQNKQVKEEKSAMNYLFVLAKVGFLENRDFQIKVKTKYTVLGCIPQSEVELMKANFVDAEETNDIDIKVGTKVMILKGSFAGLNGQVHDIKENNMAVIRIWLMHGCEPTDIDVQMSDITPQNDV